MDQYNSDNRVLKPLLYYAHTISGLRFKYNDMHNKDNFRKCGQCTACCTSLEIPSLDKSAGTSCKHLKRAGCGFYEQRPEECRGFQCAWSEKLLPSSARPDKSGLMAYRHTTKWGDTLTLIELRKGAIQRGAKYVNKLQQLVDHRGWAMLIIDSSGRTAAMIPE